MYQRHVCFCNPCARAKSHQQERVRKLCSATLNYDWPKFENTTPFPLRGQKLSVGIYSSLAEILMFQLCVHYFVIAMVNTYLEPPYSFEIQGVSEPYIQSTFYTLPKVASYPVNQNLIT